MNKAILMGRLGTDPKPIGKNGKSIVAFSVATSAGKDRTTWHNVKAFDALADSVQKYMAKGRQVLIEGTINNYEYDKDGERRYGSEVVAQRIEFVGDRGPKSADENTVSDTVSEDCPF